MQEPPPSGETTLFWERNRTLSLEKEVNSDEFWQKLADPNFISDEELWALRYKLRRELIEFAETPISTMSRPFTAPPDIPAERYQALETAFVAVHRDPQFLADAGKLGLDISPVDGNAVRDAIERMAHVSPATFDYMKKLMAAE